MKISSREQKIIELLLKNSALRSSEVHEGLLKLEDDASLVTVKRLLSDMVSKGVLLATGSGRSFSYSISTLGRIYANIDARVYCAIDPDKRYGLKSFNEQVFLDIPSAVFSDEELQGFELATTEYVRRTTDLPPAIEKRELERLVIELSWKSSKIEGNTYTLLDTEKLILEQKEAPGHTRAEAQMIINHKNAFTFIREHRTFFKKLSRAHLEELHAILVKDLNVGQGLRERVVGITGSIYRPLDNIHQVREALELLITCVDRIEAPYGKALIALLGLSYIQPFEDGNKRTARLLANAILLAYGCAPLSYRSVEEVDYREAMLVFYEINSIMPFKKIFIDQYEFAAKNYAVVS